MKGEHKIAQPIRHRGLSMIEMMVVLAIAAILMALAAPGFGDLIQSQRVTATANDFVAAINLTRSEAIRRGMRVDLVPAGDGGDWAAGWIVFVDSDDDQRPGPGEERVFSHGRVGGGIRIEAIFTDKAAQYLAYNATGRTRTNGSSQTPSYGRFRIELGEHTRHVVVNMLGRLKVCEPVSRDEEC
jgi:type IV fimbrial biogenesis protein FimT